MPYDNINPKQARMVHVEWLDITGTSDGPELSRRWTLGHLLSTTHISEGIECVVTAITWDEDGWIDFATYPKSIVLSLEDV